jgi:hypothetical protein
MDIRVFQTGRHYSEKGQRIAYTWDKDNIYFVDADRGIDGVFPNHLHELNIPHWHLMRIYDIGGYGHFNNDELYIRDALSDRAYNF